MDSRCGPDSTILTNLNCPDCMNEETALRRGIRDSQKEATALDNYSKVTRPFFAN